MNDDHAKINIYPIRSIFSVLKSSTAALSTTYFRFAIININFHFSIRNCWSFCRYWGCMRVHMFWNIAQNVEALVFARMAIVKMRARSIDPFGSSLDSWIKRVLLRNIYRRSSGRACVELHIHINILLCIWEWWWSCSMHRLLDQADRTKTASALSGQLRTAIYIPCHSWLVVEELC